MDDISTYEEETAQTKLVRNGMLVIVFLFVIVVACLSIIDGFNGSGREGIALMGIGLALFAITTFVLLRRIFKQDIDEAAKIPTYMQLIMLIFLGIAILIADYSDSSSNSSGNCSSLPSCLYSGTCCVYYSNDNYEESSISSTNGTSTCTWYSVDSSNYYYFDNSNENNDNNDQYDSAMPNQKYIEQLYYNFYNKNNIEKSKQRQNENEIENQSKTRRLLSFNNKQEHIEYLENEILKLNKQVDNLKKQLA